MFNNGNSGIYEFGKWVETNVIPIISKHFNMEVIQTAHQFCDIDAMIYKFPSVYPCQFKAYAPRIFYKDISMELRMYQKYLKIAESNNGYKVFQVNTIYNPQFKLDYKVYGFDIINTEPIFNTFSANDDRAVAYFKYKDMKEYDILPLDFQREMEKLKFELNPPSPDYSQYYKRKF
jgi:hypothetical protein